jgi:hypothetical protein
MLSDHEIRCYTTEKEAYAIVYCLRKLEYLLRDRSFTLRTDHKNPIYIDTETSAKVKRWKLLEQEYAFFIEHIAGKLNIAADGFSRLLPLREEHLYLHEEFALSKEEYDTIVGAHNEVVGHHGVDRTLGKLTSQKMSYLRTPSHTPVHNGLL